MWNLWKIIDLLTDPETFNIVLLSALSESLVNIDINGTQVEKHW